MASLGAPQWASDHHLKPPPVTKLSIIGSGVPAELVIMPKRKASLEIDGPGRLRIRAWGLMKKQGRRFSDPGKLTIKIGKTKKSIELSGKVLKYWSVDKRKTWRVGYPSVLTFKLHAGTNMIVIVPSRKAAQGYAMVVEVERPGEPAAAEPAVAKLATTEPVAEAPAAAEPTIPQPPILPPPEDDAPPLMGTSAPDDVDLPDLAASPLASATMSPGMTVDGSPPTRKISAPGGSLDFYQISIDDGLQIDVTGPGSLVLHLHAHRSEALAASLEPVVVGLLLDDVLVHTVSVDQPASERFRFTDVEYLPSRRVTVRIQIPVGKHVLQLSLSDNATLGASVRPQFVVIGETEEPSVLDFDSAREGDLRASGVLGAEVAGGGRVGVVAGAWLPNSLPAPGATVAVDVALGIPSLARGASIGFFAGFSRVTTTRHFEDPRKPDGQGRMPFTLSNAPIFLDVRWSLGMPVDGLSIDLGAGGGVLITWTDTRSRQGHVESGLRLVPGGIAQATVDYQIGPGSVMVKIAAIIAQRWSAANVNDFDSGAFMLSAGYRFSIYESEAVE
ncbi:MAG: hypothetical protein V3T05_08895 [Myxococcota bacterium]